MEFSELLRNRYRLSDEAIGLLIQGAERLEFDRKQLIVEQGQRDAYVYFVEQGAVRSYVMRGERCVIICFAFEGDQASLFPDPNSRTAHYYIETIEPTSVVRFRREALEGLYACHAELADWARRIAEERLRIHEEYFADYAWRGKSEQYKAMLREYPQLLQRIPLKDLASYLYVSPQSLSRIRAELARS